MSDNDGFDEIVGSFGDDTPDSKKIKFKDPSDLLEFYWKKFYPDTMYVKSVLIAEVVDKDGTPALLWDYPDSMTQWDLRGMLATMHDQLMTRDVVNRLAGDLFEDDDDEDSSEENND